MPTKTSALVRLALLTSVLCATATLQAQIAPILDYVNHPDFKSARLSPDGAHIAMVVPQDKTELVAILDTATLQTKAVFATEEYYGILQYWWANNERIVFSTSFRFPGSDESSQTGDLYAFNVDNDLKFLLAGPTGNERAVYRVLDTLATSHDKVMVVRWEISRNSIARSQPIAYLMDIYKRPRSGQQTGTNVRQVDRLSKRVPSPLPWGNLMSDHDGNVTLAYAVNEAGQIDVKLLQDGEWVDKAAFLSTDAGSLSSGAGLPLGFNSANTGIYHLATSPHGTVGIALFDIASNESTLLYAHEQYDVTNGDLLISADGKDLIGVTLMSPLPQMHFFSEHQDIGLYRSLERSLPGFRINFQNFSEDQRKGLALVSGPTMVPALFLLDRDKGEFSPLFSSMPEIQSAPMTMAQPVKLTARDGTPLEAYLTPAAGIEGSAPLVVLVHGGPHGIRDLPEFNPEVKLLASRGYSVLQVNFRGSGGYGTPFMELGYRNWGTTMIDDIVDATRFVADQGLVEPDRMCVMGASFGGYAAMMAIARYPELYKCGVGISGVYDLDLMRKSDIPFFPGGDAYLEQIIGSDEAELRANSPITLAGSIKVPVFLAQGGDDRRVLPKNAERFKDVLDDLGVDYEWFYVPTAGHGFALPRNREDLYTALFEFFSAHL